MSVTPIESQGSEHAGTKVGTENTLIQILQKVLEKDGIEANDRFSDIGGDSVNLVEVLTQIEDKLGVTPNPRLFFDQKTSTVVELSKAIDVLREAVGSDASDQKVAK